MEIKFEVPGKVQPKQRPRRGKGGVWYTPKETKDYEGEVRWAAKIAMKGRKLLDGSVCAEIDILVPIPKSWPSCEVKKALARTISPKSGDLDNKIKSLLDGMNGIIYKDDKQISRILASQRYGLEPKAIVKVDSL